MKQKKKRKLKKTEVLLSSLSNQLRNYNQPWLSQPFISSLFNFFLMVCARAATTHDDNLLEWGIRDMWRKANKQEVKSIKRHIFVLFLFPALTLTSGLIHHVYYISATVRRRMYTSSSWSSSRYKRTENFRIALKFIMLFLKAVVFGLMWFKCAVWVLNFFHEETKRKWSKRSLRPFANAISFNLWRPKKIGSIKYYLGTQALFNFRVNFDRFF